MSVKALLFNNMCLFDYYQCDKKTHCDERPAPLQSHLNGQVEKMLATTSVDVVRLFDAIIQVRYGCQLIEQ